MPYREVKRQLKKERIILDHKTISNIINSRGKRRQAELQGEIYKEEHRPSKMIGPVLKKVDNNMSKENPRTQTSMAQQLNVSQSTICRAIHRILDRETRKKTSVHVLNMKDKKNRMENCWKIYKHHLAGDKCKYVVTLDESYARLKVNGRTTEFCYVRRGEKVPEDWVKPVRSNFQQKMMIVGAMSYFGTFPLIRIRRKTITSHCYVTQVLQPLINNYILPLFGEEASKVFVHFDKAPVHVSNFTKTYMDIVTERHGIKFIEKDDIPVRGADCAPLDFFGFGFLKKKVEAEGAKNLDQLWQKCKTIWTQVSSETCGKVYESWKLRCRKIVERKGSHIEQVKSIHKHKNKMKVAK